MFLKIGHPNVRCGVTKIAPSIEVQSRTGCFCAIEKLLVGSLKGDSGEPVRAAVRIGPVIDGTSEDEAEDSGQLHNDVERRARCVLQGVAHGLRSQSSCAPRNPWGSLSPDHRKRCTSS